MIRGLNHVTLAVADLERSLGFYTTLLGFRARRFTSHSAYLEAGSLWLALVLEEGERFEALPNGYSHIALSVDKADFDLVKERLRNAGATCWQESEREDSFYFCDPDGHQLEIHSGDLRSRLAESSGATQPAQQDAAANPANR